MQVLVTGANGQLGMCIKKMADQFPTVNFSFFSSTGLNITNKAEVETCFSQLAPTYCINCAAYTNVEQAEKEPEKAFQINAEGVRNLSEACKKSATVLIHISTDYVFDGEKEGPYTINDLPNPINEYGKSKLAGEQYVQNMMDRYFIIRTSWLYSEFGNNFYKTILKKLEKGEPLYITNEQKGKPTNANDLAGFIMRIIVDGYRHYGILHFGGKKAMTWYEFALEIVKENHLQGQAKIEIAKNYVTLAKRPKNSVLANSHLS